MQKKLIFCFILMFLIFTFNIENVISKQIYFEDDFEDQTYTNWDTYWNEENINVNTVNPHSGSYSAEFFYYIPAGGAEHRDTNMAIMDSSSQNIDVMYFRAYLNIKSRDTSDYTWTNHKLFYVYSQNWDTTYDNNQWDVVVDFVLNTDDTQFTFGLKSNSYPHYGLGSSTAKIYNFDQWYCVELGVGLNDLGKSNGWVKLWIDGSLVLEETGISFRTDVANDYGNIGVGYQVNRVYDDNERAGYRYWDDFVFASDYIGPVNGTINKNSLQPPPYLKKR